jgi:hypothetical protein
VRVLENRAVKRYLDLRGRIILRPEKTAQQGASLSVVLKSRSMRWVGHVACIREKRNAYS